MRLALLVLGCLVLITGAQSSIEASQPRGAPTPVRMALEQMSQVERKNSSISVEFESSSSEAVALGHEVERLWNGGRYDEALVELGNLEARVGHVAIGNSWRRPVPTVETALWGHDVRIGNRDSLLELALDRSINQGHLFVALRHEHGPTYYSVCMSADSGASWAETFTWVGSPVTCLGAANLGDFFVAYYAPGENTRHVRLRRFQSRDGSATEFSTGSMWVVPCTLDVGDTAKEAALVSSGSSWLFISTLVSDGGVLLTQSDGAAVAWTRLETGITSGASRGLNGTYDLAGTYCVWLSYLDATDTLRICYVRTFGSGHGLLAFAPACGPSALTSISAYSGNIICAYEDGTTSPQAVRYAVSNDGGDTWTTGTLGDTSIAAEAPAVSTTYGLMFLAVFRQESSIPELRFWWRTDSGPWFYIGSPADNAPYRSRPGVKQVVPGWGLAYLSDTSPVVRGAYFDRSDWSSGFAEQERPQPPGTRSLATVVRSVLMLPRDMTETSDVSDRVPRPSLLDAAGRKVLDLKSGVNDVSGLAPGVYFVREAQAQAQAQAVRKVVIAR